MLKRKWVLKMNKLVEKLRKKGWSEKDIYKAIEIINNSERYKPEVIKKIDKLAYWSTLIVAIIGNFIISIVLIPFLILLKSFPVYLIIAIIALPFGFLFQLIIKDVEKTIKKRYIMLNIFIPAIAIINMYYMTSFSNYLNSLFGLPPIKHNPLLVGLIYVIAFVLPYFITKRKE